MIKTLKKTFITAFVFIILITFTACQDKEKVEQPEAADKIPNTMKKASDELEQIITLLGGPLFNEHDTIERTKNEQLQMLTEKLKDSSLGTQEETSLQKDSESQEKEEPQSKSNNEQSSKEGSGESSNKEDDSEKEQGMEDEQSQDESKENVSGGKDTQQTQKNQQSKTFQYVDSIFGIPKWKDDNWNMIKVLTDGMHFTWNDLEPELIKKGVSQNQSENFSGALVELSHNVSTKSIKESQNAAFHMSQALSEFYSYYKTNIPPELNRITSHVTGIHFAVEQNDWSIAQDIANELQQEFTKLKVSVEDNQSHTFQMLELSVNDLYSAVQNQDSVLAIIRTNLVNTNINELDAKLSNTKE